MTPVEIRRHLLLTLMRIGLAAVDGRSCTSRALAARRFTRPVRIAAIGKAASSMALGAHDALGDAIEQSLIITKDGHTDASLAKLPNTEIIESSHPVPDERSLHAGERLLQWVETLPAGVEPIFLISGGASSLVEALVPGLTLEDLQRLNKEGLASGLSIDALNARRREISRIKGGRLTAKLQGRPALALFISDVPQDDPAVIGSGLLGPAPDGDDRVERIVVASIDHAVKAVFSAANDLGLLARMDPVRFSQDAQRLGVRFAHELQMDETQLRVWGGESVVTLPEKPGRGGRNQQLALAAARQIAGYEDLALLAVGTDGTDGPTSDAGALVDANTCARLSIASIDADESLRNADAGTALAAAGDLLHTGPTGTNVGDLVIGVRLSEGEAQALYTRHGKQWARML